MAKRFVFRLAAVERHRRRIEDDCRRRVAEALRRIAREESELRSIEEELRGELAGARAGRLLPTLDVMLARRQRGYIAWLERRRLEGEDRLRALQAQLKVEQETLLRATRDVKVMQKLRQRQHSRWADMERRAERVEEDEIGRQAFLSHGAGLGWDGQAKLGRGGSASHGLAAPDRATREFSVDERGESSTCCVASIK
jgi:flagellar export protein FliJ